MGHGFLRDDPCTKFLMPLVCVDDHFRRLCLAKIVYNHDFTRHHPNGDYVRVHIDNESGHNRRSVPITS
jgi:hypothetical protein